MQDATGPEIKVSLLPGNAGHISEAFVGFSYEKDEVALPIFTGENHNLIGLFLLNRPRTGCPTPRGQSSGPDYLGPIRSRSN